MSTTTLDSGVFPDLGIRADRKTPAPWSMDDIMPASESMIGAAVRPRRPRTASHLKVVAETPTTGWASPPPIITRRAVMLFQLSLAAMCVVSVFVL